MCLIVCNPINQRWARTIFAARERIMVHREPEEGDVPGRVGGGELDHHPLNRVLGLIDR